MKTGRKAALLLAVLVLALIYCAPFSYGADTKPDGQNPVKSTVEATSQPAQSQPKPNGIAKSQKTNSDTVPSHNLNTLPYPGSGK
ncbi:MAG: hypothetical protein HQK99_15965 [Nitrospirae bacterium]|nr:hypothetical protein [Nitrospirota bacterium]